MKTEIKTIHARQILDSRANPTVEAEVVFNDGSFGRASAPSGASTGATEAKELRDEDMELYIGKGVMKAVFNINGEINAGLSGKNLNQEELDGVLMELDGTEDKSRLGANAMLAVSLAFAKASAAHISTTLYSHLGQGFHDISNMPRPMFNILNGGAHADSGLSFQEFMVVPKRDSFNESLRCGVEIYHSLKKLLIENGLKTSVGDEGGFAPAIETNDRALELIREAGDRIGYRAGDDYEMSLDIAANEIKEGDRYLYNGGFLDRDSFINEIISLSERFPILSIEDPLEENDEEGFIKLNDAIGNRVIIVGDDFLVTDPVRIHEAHERGSAGGAIIKPNQIGTVTETLTAIRTANASDIKTVVSHRSGETEDVAIAHLAVGTNSTFVKFGAPARGERTAKYNELLRIEEELLRSGAL